MSSEQLQALTPAAFKRTCGVSRETFLSMAEVLKPYLERQGKGEGLLKNYCKLTKRSQNDVFRELICTLSIKGALTPLNWPALYPYA